MTWIVWCLLILIALLGVGIYTLHTYVMRFATAMHRERKAKENALDALRLTTDMFEDFLGATLAHPALSVSINKDGLRMIARCISMSRQVNASYTGEPEVEHEAGPHGTWPFNAEGKVAK